MRKGQVAEGRIILGAMPNSWLSPGSGGSGGHRPGTDMGAGTGYGQFLWGLNSRKRWDSYVAF